MTNLHELTKQLDVLTWNARSVLNALIRSAMAAGSNNGFTVNRAGQKIQIDKEDIYRIYNFYEKWEAAGYPSDERFDGILASENACYGKGDQVTQSLVKHAKVIWLDATNKDDPTDAWIQRIYTTSNPKWFTNTAPIPLNIRTPIYDENLSTKTYDSYETYLFPNGYYSIDTLGFYGDNTSHMAGGQTWSFDVRELFSVNADRILLGDHDHSKSGRNTNIIDSLYNSYTPKFAIEGGYDCYAFDRNAFSYGMQNNVNGANSAILGGRSNSVLTNQSSIIGGISNVIAADDSAIVSGHGNMIAGLESNFAANYGNMVGGYCYDFSRQAEGSSTETDCPPTYTSQDNPNCTYILQQDSGTAIDGTPLSSDQVFISADTVKQSGMGPVCYVSMYRKTLTEYTPFDFKSYDWVKVFAIIGTDTERLAYKPLVTKVLNIQKLDNNGQIHQMDDRIAEVGYIVTLDCDLVKDYGGNIVHGFICRERISDYPVEYLPELRQSTRASSAFGYNTIAAGFDQMVVGSSNVELLNPRFIVGSGTSYILSDVNRMNSFVSAPKYTYSKTSNYIISGVSDYTTATFYGEDGLESDREHDEDLVYGIEKYHGFYAYHNPPTHEFEGRALLRVFEGLSTLSIGWNGIRLYQPVLASNPTQTRTVWNEIYCRDGSISLHSGSADYADIITSDNNWAHFYAQDVRVSSIPGEDHTITVWARDKVGVHGHDTLIHANNESGYISLDAYALSISAITRGALTAQPTTHNVEPFALRYVPDRSDNANEFLDTIKDTGHVYTTKALSGRMDDTYLHDVMNDRKFLAFHVFTSSHLLNYANGNGTYDVAQLLLPGQLEPGCNRSMRGTKYMPRPVVIANTVVANDNGVGKTYRDTRGYLYEELAYLSDVRSISTQVLNNVVNPAYAMHTAISVSKSRIDDSSMVLDPYTSPGYAQYACVSDSFLDSLITTSNQGAFYISEPVDVDETNKYIGKLVRAKSMSGNAGLMSTFGDINNYPEFFLNGVAINPAFRMISFVMQSPQQTTGITYLAMAPNSMRNDAIDDIYNYNLLRNSSGGLDPEYRTLYTSKFSRGQVSKDAVTDLCDVWAITSPYSNSSDLLTNVQWQLLLKDLLIVYANGRLSVEFKINWPVFSRYAFLPTSDSSDPDHNALKVSTTAKKYDCVAFNGGYIKLMLPLDPTVANYIEPVVSQQTDVASVLYGQAEIDATKSVFVTGQFVKSLASARHDLTSNVDPGYSYIGPYLVIDLNSWSGVEVSNITQDIQVHMEGVVSNVN